MALSPRHILHPRSLLDLVGLWGLPYPFLDRRERHQTRGVPLTLCDWGAPGVAGVRSITAPRPLGSWRVLTYTLGISPGGANKSTT